MKQDTSIQIDRYQVGIKILLKKDNTFLALFSADTNYFDLPGGRINQGEEKTPISQIIDREIKEELGGDLKYQLGQPLFQCRRLIPKKDLKIFLTIYEAQYISGSPVLSHEHAHFSWKSLRNVKLSREEFECEEEYLAFKNYFAKI